MRKHLICVATAALLGASASASAANNDWTGWYVGGHAGQANGDSSSDVTLGGAWSSEGQDLIDHTINNSSADLEPSGGAYGVHVGYDYQFTNAVVLGMELDYSRLNIDDSSQTGQLEVPTIPGLSYDYGNSIELDDRLALRARLGIASGQHLVYVTAGYVRVGADASASILGNNGYSKLGTASETLDGIEWGVGYEYAFGNQWSVRAEYLATDMDDFQFANDYVAGSTFTSPEYLEFNDQDLDFDTFRIGVNYRF